MTWDCDKCSGTGWFDDNCSPLPESVVCPDCGGIDPSETPQAKLLRVRDEISALLEREGCFISMDTQERLRLGDSSDRYAHFNSIEISGYPTKQQEQGG